MGLPIPLAPNLQGTRTPCAMQTSTPSPEYAWRELIKSNNNKEYCPLHQYPIQALNLTPKTDSYIPECLNGSPLQYTLTN